jgi:spore maturation protein CgeB
LNFVFLGLSITSSWGNGHATTYRALLKYLSARGHAVTFIERDLSFYAENRDLPDPTYARTYLYDSLEELKDRFSATVAEADLVVVGSYVPEGVAVGDWALDLAPGRTAFYDIDTPITLERMAQGTAGYITREQVSRYAMYVSFTGGPTLDVLERQAGSPCARALYCSVDPEVHYPEGKAPSWDLGYLGTYSADRQPALERLLIEPARAWPAGRFVVAGPMYPEEIAWPSNVERTTHLAPGAHRDFYGRQRFTLNVTRAPMIHAGWSPSVRLFEAAACGTPIVSDRWAGLETLFEPGARGNREILIADTTADVQAFLRELPEDERIAIGERARRRVLAEHTSMHRAETLEQYTRELFERQARRSRVGPSPASSRAGARARAGTSTM